MVLQETLFLKKQSRTPIWLMRQAGRYLPEYRELRKKAGSFLNMCYTPELATEITLQPLRRFDLDAAIIFSDILVIPHGLGQDLTFAEGEGPVLTPLHTPFNLNKFNLHHMRDFLKPVYQAITDTRQALKKETALIGFCGAPFTLACYMIDGRGKTGFPRTVQYAKEHPEDFSLLIDYLTKAATVHLSEQIKAGSNAVQIFDSWAALCPESKIQDWVIKPVNHITAQLKKEHPLIPVIGFPRGLGLHYSTYIEKTEVQGIGVDYDQNIAKLASATQRRVCWQGNLDPEILLAGGEPMTDQIHHIMDGMKNHPFIFNLGHGVIKETPPEHVSALIETVRRLERKIAA